MAATAAAADVAVAATADDVAERARAHTLNNSNRTPRDNDRSYASEWKNYCAWVSEHRANNILPAGPKYLTRENVDLYFSERVVNRTITPESARRVVSSLQRFADDVEYVDGTVTFTVDSVVVKRDLESHKRLLKELKISSRGSDHARFPHL